MVIHFVHGSGRFLRRASALLVAVAALLASNAAPFVDTWYASPNGPHFEMPGDPATEHPNHNHTLCALVGATHVLHAATPTVAVGPGSETRTQSLPPRFVPTGSSFTTQRSRAPPPAPARA